MTAKTTASFAPFEERFRAIINLAEGWEQYFQNPKRSHDLELSSLLREFQEFATDYFEYFKADIDHPEYTLTQVIQRLQLEFDNISLACIQRKLDEFAARLYDADQQAKIFYDRFTGFKPQATPVSYFGKNHAITRYPFTPYALVSVPVELYNQPEQWWALSHELGHHIYWNSAEIDTYRQLHRTLQDIVLQTAVAFYYARNNLGVRSDTGALPAEIKIADLDSLVQIKELVVLAQLWMGWLEETFADICGTMMAGVGFVEGAIGRAKAVKDLFENEGEHPIPCVRPLIGIETLEWVHKFSGVPTTSQAAELDQAIKGLRSQAALLCVGSEAKENLPALIGGDLDTIRESIRPVVHTLLGSQAWKAAFSKDRRGSAEPAPQQANVTPIEKLPEKKLGELFIVADWLENIPEIEYAAEAQGTEARIGSQPPAHEPRQAFTATKKYLEEQIKGENITGEKKQQRLRELLLELDLGEEKQVDAVAYTTLGGLVSFVQQLFTPRPNG